MQEEIRTSSADNTKSNCEFCGGSALRAYDKENVIIRPDLEPGYNESLGEHVGSRRELREKLAFHNAASPDLVTNSYPSDGRLTKEERAEVADKRNSVFDRRQRPGWGSNPVGEAAEEGIAVEGKANYQEIRDVIKKRHKKRGE